MTPPGPSGNPGTGINKWLRKKSLWALWFVNRTETCFGLNLGEYKVHLSSTLENIFIYCTWSKDCTVDYHSSWCPSWAPHSVLKQCPGVIVRVVEVYGVKIRIAIPSTDNVKRVPNLCHSHERNFSGEFVCWNRNLNKLKGNVLNTCVDIASHVHW